MAKKKAKRTAEPVPVDAIKHKESRTNIPTRELAAFAGDDEREPKSIRYPRDPSLDPQLVWKGKDEQDHKALEVPAVPIYIQEKIHPQALIEELRTRAAAGKERQLDLFADFNGLDEFDKKVDFYHHDQHWSNRLILGDSLLVMTSLAEKERLKGRVQTIYLDPPYGIKFGSNWQVSTRKREVKDPKVEDVTRQPEQIKAFRDTWQLGIHSYLTYLRDRLTVARDLLTESGSIFVQIGDENVHLVRCVMDEVFGSENFCGQIGYKKTGSFESLLLQRNFDIVLWYSKYKSAVKYRELFDVSTPSMADTVFFDYVELPDGSRVPLKATERIDPASLPSDWKLLARNPLNSEGYVQALHFQFHFDGETFTPPPNRHWTTTEAGMKRLAIAGRLIKKGQTLRYVRYWDDYPSVMRNCMLCRQIQESSHAASS